MNLGWEYAKFESPNEAYFRKMRPEQIFALNQKKIFK